MTRGFYWGDRAIFISPLLPMRSTTMGPMKLSPFVDVSDEFRAKMDAWLKEFFGETHYPQPSLTHAIVMKNERRLFVSAELYRRLEQVTTKEELTRLLRS